MFKHEDVVDKEDENGEETDDSDDDEFVSKEVDVENIKPLLEKF